MSTIHLNQTTTATPEQFVAGLTDFGPGRSKLFGNSADEYLKVHDQGPGQADVTEGSGGIWERLHYDWSDPNRVVMTTTDSNVWGGALGPHLHPHAAARRDDRHRRRRGARRQEHQGTGARSVFCRIVGKRVLGGELAKTVRAIEVPETAVQRRSPARRHETWTRRHGPLNIDARASLRHPRCCRPSPARAPPAGAGDASGVRT